MNTQTNPTIDLIQANTFYAIYDNAKEKNNDKGNGIYSIVKIIKMAHSEKNGNKLKVCQYTHVFKRLPNLVYVEQLGEASAQYWLEVNEFIDWQPTEVAVIDSYSSSQPYPSAEDELEWVV